MSFRTTFPLALCLVVACAPVPEARGVEALSLHATTPDGRFEVALRTSTDGIPLNEPFELFVEVRDHARGSEDADDGAELDLSVDGFMPGHGHGMLRTARVERQGDGTWCVRGMLFHMGGEWELRVRIAWPDESSDGRFFTIRHQELAFPCEPVLSAHAAQDRARALFTDAELERLLSASPPPALPADPTNAVADDPRAAALGRSLFYDERLSGDGKRSCASCHDPEQGWSDGLATAEGRESLDLHTPTLWNVAHQRWQFWDGRADSLWAQALQPIEDEREMGGSREAVAALIAEDAELRAAYAQVFGEAGDADEVFADVGKAIAAFERRIVTGETPFDRFARGLETGDAADLAALDLDARDGAKLFFGRARCHLCHNGPTFSDLEFHDVRVPVDADQPLAQGRFVGIAKVLVDPFNGLGKFSDDRGQEARDKLLYLARTPHTLGEMKTPGLRNVALTAPYMHAGQFATLEETVAHYSSLEDAEPKRHQESEDVLNPANLTEREQEQLIAFLRSLTSGPPDADLLDPERQPEG